MVATLDAVQDVTANAALLTLLAGPRWAIGPRDLALLGRRARELAGSRQGGESFADVEAAAARRPSRAPTRPRSRRCATRSTTRATSTTPPRRATGSRLLADELRRLRAAIGEPLLDLVRRIIDTTGIDVELASSVSPAAAARRDNLDLFVEAVAEFQAVDGAGHPGRAAGLARGRGRVRPGPRRGDAVRGRLGQAADRPPRQGPRVGRGLPGRRHRAQVPDQPRPVELARRCRRVMPAALRGDARDLPQLGRAQPPTTSTRSPRPPRPTRRVEELRLGVRRVDPRPAPARRVVRGAGPATSRRGLGPSRVPPAHPRGDGRLGRRARRVARHAGRRARSARYADAVARPALADLAPHRRGRPPDRRGRSWSARPRPGGRPTTLDDLLLLDAGRSSGTTRSSGCSTRRGASRRRRDRGPAAASLSATSLARLRDDPDGVRPRPGPADAAAAVAGGAVRHPLPRLGRGARSASSCCSTPTTCPAARDADIDDDADLRELIEAVRGRAVRRPGAARRSSRRSRWCSAGQVVRGRIDAVYAERRRRLPAWSTGRPTAPQTADPLQLAIYRAGLGRAHRRAARAGPGGVLLRPHRPAGRARRPAGAGRARAAARAG